MNRIQKTVGALILPLAILAASFAVVPQQADAATWTAVASSCKNGGVAGWSFYNVCWQTKKLSGDTNTTRDYWELKMTSSGNSVSPKKLEKLWVEPYPKVGTATQNWEGATPFAPNSTTNSSSNCVTHSFSISGGEPVTLGYSVSHQVCDKEQIGPKLYADAGHHAAIWSTTAPVNSSQVRNVSALVNVRVAQGSTAVWMVDRVGANARS